MIADTSIWIDYFAGRYTASTNMLDAALASAPPLLPDLVAFEVLRGCRYERDARRANHKFGVLEWVVLGGPVRSAAAAERYRTLRKVGATIRTSIDVLIASYCIDEQVPLLFDDRDFLPFVEHLGLRRVG